MRAFFFLLVVFAASVAAAANGPLSYQVNGERFTGYFVSPADRAPLVLLVHDWDGLTDYEIRRAEMLAARGYAVFAVDLFGAGVRPTTLEEKKALTTNLYKDRARMRTLLQGGLEAAREQGADVANAVGMGYCFGGSAVLEWARSSVDLKGFVSFHGGLETPEGQDYRTVKGDLLILHGTADHAVSMQQFAVLADILEQQDRPHEMITYSGAPHAFTVFGAESYREDADRKSWQRFTEFLRATLR